jgi:hypothetical protein
MDKVLWDRDWEMEALFPPERGFTVTMAMARIEPDYFKPYGRPGEPGARERVYGLLIKKIDEIEAAERAAEQEAGRGSAEGSEEDESGSEEGDNTKEDPTDKKAAKPEGKKDSEAPEPQPPPKRTRRR